MSQMDPVEQISDALSRLRLRGGRPHRGGQESHDHVGHHVGHHEGHRNAHHRGHDHGSAHGDRRGGHTVSDRRGSGGPALGRLLWVLAAAGEPLSISEVAELIGVDQPRASRLVAQGVEFGLLRREVDAADARRTRIVLTGQGNAMVQRMRAERGAAVREALEGFSEAERGQFARLLGRFADAWPR